MSSHDEQVQQRQANLAELAQARRRDLSAHVRRGSTRSPQLVDAHGQRTHDELEAEHVTTITSGRILAIRAFGKANFLVLSDGRAKIQVYIRQDALPELDFQIFKLLDFGDWVGVEGRLFRTKTNELTIWASRLHFLAKCLLPLPEKWHGLTDVEIRYRQRYLDLIVNPDSRRVFEARSRVVAAHPRVHDRARLPRGRDADDAADRRRRARAAVRHASQRARHGALPAHRARAVPEAARRRRPREGVRDQPQLPERGDLDAAQPRVHDDGVLRGLRRLPGADAHDRGDDRDAWRDRRSAPIRSRSASIRSRWRRRSRGCRCARRRARRRRAGSGATSPTPTCATASASRRSPRELGLEVEPGHGAGKIATEIFERLCEDRLIQPTFVYDFPTEVSPLSKQKPDDPDTVERFELYIGGFEVANAFSELNDPVEQRRRFEAQLEGPRARRPRGARDGRGLHPRARVRPAADRRRRRRHRSPRDAADQQPVDPRRHPVPADASRRETERRPICDVRQPWICPSSCTSRCATCSPSASRRSSRVISLISTLGVTVGVMALVIALALMTGLQQELRDRIVGSNPHIYVWKHRAASPTTAPRPTKLRAVPHVRRRGAGDPRAGRCCRPRASRAGHQIKGIDPGARAAGDRHLRARCASGSVERARRRRDGEPAGHPARQGSRRQARRRGRRLGARC